MFEVLVYVHFSLYELHTALLRRSVKSGFVVPEGKANQPVLHTLKLATDTIDSFGTNDVVVGDSLALYVQIDKPDNANGGFLFDDNYYKSSQSTGLSSSLSDIANVRESQIKDYIENVLLASTPLTNSEETQLGFTDVPFTPRLSNDRIDLNMVDNVGVGDFAVFGVVTSTSDVSNAGVQDDLMVYVDSIKNLRTLPGVTSWMDRFVVYGKKLPPYDSRYDSKNYPEPEIHSDTMIGNSTENAIFGQFVTITSFLSEDGATLSIDTADGFFGQYQNYVYNTQWMADNITVVEGTSVEADKKEITEIRRRQLGGGKFEAAKRQAAMMLFQSHPLVVQFKNDHQDTGIFQSELVALKDDVTYSSFENGKFVDWIPQAPEIPEIVDGPS